MAITVVGVGAQSAGTVSGNAIPASYPAAYTATAGDLAIILVGGRPSDATMPSAPAGGYAIRSSRNRATATLSIATFWKILDGSEASDPTVTIPATWTNGLSAQMIVVRGADPVTPFDVADVVADVVAAATYTPGSIVTATNGALVVACVGSADDNALSLSTPNSFDDRMSGASYDTTAGTDHSVAMASITKATAGTQTMPTWTQTTNGNDAWANITMAVRPATEPDPIDASGSPTSTLSSSTTGTATQIFNASGSPTSTLSSSAAGTATQKFNASGSPTSTLSSSAVGAATEKFNASGSPTSTLSSSTTGAGVETIPGSGAAVSTLVSSATGEAVNVPPDEPAPEPARTARGRRKNRRRQDAIHLENLRRRLELEAAQPLEEMLAEDIQVAEAEAEVRAEEIQQADYDAGELFKPVKPKPPAPRRPPPINEDRFALARKPAMPAPIDVRTLRMIEEEEEEIFLRDLLARL